MSADRTRDLRRYILGLALVAVTAPQSAYLRQGCNLVPDIDVPRESTLVHGDGKREAFGLSHEGAVAFARSAAQVFKVGTGQAVEFKKDLAKQDVSGDAPAEGDAPAKSKKKK